MRLRHAKQAAEGLPAETPDQQQAKAVLVEQVERLRWRTWHGKAENARLTLRRVRKLLPAFKGSRGKAGEPARKLRRALGKVDGYLRRRVAWTRSSDALAPTPSGIRRCAQRSGVPAPACG
jgi:hypothetical protein